EVPSDAEPEGEVALPLTYLFSVEVGRVSETVLRAVGAEHDRALGVGHNAAREEGHRREREQRGEPYLGTEAEPEDFDRAHLVLLGAAGDRDGADANRDVAEKADAVYIARDVAEAETHEVAVAVCVGGAVKAVPRRQKAVLPEQVGNVALAKPRADV